MGILSSIGKFVETRFFPVVGISGVSTTKRLLTEPKKEVLRAVGETVVGLTIAQPTIVLKGAGAVIKTAFKKAPITSTGIALAAPSVAIAVVKSPKLQKTILGAPEKYIEASTTTGTEIAGFVEEPTLAKGLEIIKSHPYLTAAAAATLLASFGYGALMITNILSNARLKGYLVKETAPVTEGLPVITAGGLVPEKTLTTDEGLPSINETATITTGKRRRRKVKAAIIPSVRQNVQVILSSRNVGYQINKRYLNEKVFA